MLGKSTLSSIQTLVSEVLIDFLKRIAANLQPFKIVLRPASIKVVCYYRVDGVMDGLVNINLYLSHKFCNCEILA